MVEDTSTEDVIFEAGWYLQNLQWLY